MSAYSTSHQPPPPGPVSWRGRHPIWFSSLLWLLAFLLMVSTAIYQRRTGPTYPLRGVAMVGAQEVKYRLIRSEETTQDARVRITPPSSDISGTVFYKRFKTSDAFSAVTMQLEEGNLTASLPRQPAAGKLEYYVELAAEGKVFRLPEESKGNAVLRYKDPVPALVLIPHIIFMFFAVMIGIRAGLSALAGLPDMKRLIQVALLLMTVGGLVLGPIVQKYAFGAYWTGYPFGKDLTDNKVLVMWLCWGLVALLMRFQARLGEKVCRLAVGLGTMIMLGVYLIPHSMRGSELDYKKLDSGVDPLKAIETGR